jgi:SAM-dependent methyltransferase
LDGRTDAASGLLRCGTCGASTTFPFPSQAEIDEAYGVWYRPSSGRFSFGGDAILRWTRSRLARRLDSIAPPGPILEVGCGDGVLLDALRAAGRTAVGLERGAERPDVLANDITEIDGKWAAVVFWHSLEHLIAPAAAIRHAVGLLAPRGVLVIAIPNPASLQARLFGGRWFALDLPRHLVHVPAPSLLERLRAEGLGLERVSYLRGGQVAFGWLHGLVGSLPARFDLYQAIRRPTARAARAPAWHRPAALLSAIALLPVAALAAGVEAVFRRGGTVYVEARGV